MGYCDDTAHCTADYDGRHLRLNVVGTSAEESSLAPLALKCIAFLMACQLD